MAGLSKDSEVSELFAKVFTEGPLEELINQCDVVTAASLVGSSNLFLQSAKLSATLPASHPFGLPCILHSHPTRRLWEYNQGWPVGTECSLTPLDRLSTDALMPNGYSELRAGSNGDWIATVGLEGNWNLVNVYTRCKISLPLLPEVQTTGSVLTFIDHDGHLELQKIAICEVPIAAGKYKDFSLVAIFDFKIAILHGNNVDEWTILENQFLGHFRYHNAIIHRDHVFAVTEHGCVYAWDPLSFGPMRFRAPHEYLQLIQHEEHEVDDRCMWWLARSPHGSKLVLVYTHGVTDEDSGIHPTHVAADDIVHYVCTLQTYASGFHCMVFSMDTRTIHLNKQWKRVHDIGQYSLFLGLKYPINIALAGADVALGNMARRNCVYTSHHALGYEYRPHPKVCRFSLNATDAAVGFSTNTAWALSETPFWFIPSLANAANWH